MTDPNKPSPVFPRPIPPNGPRPDDVVARLARRVEDLEKKLLSFGAMNLVLATTLRQRRLLDDDEFASIVLAANQIHEKGGPSTFEELLAWAKASR